MESLIFLVAIFVVMWLLFIRPQQKRVRSQQQMLSSLQPGDEVVTAGGIIGTIRAIDDAHIQLQVGGGVELRVVRGAISRRVGPEQPEPDESGDETHG